MIELSDAFITVIAVFLGQGGLLIWKLADLTRQAKTTSERLSRIERKLYNGREETR